MSNLFRQRYQTNQLPQTGPRFIWVISLIIFLLSLIVLFNTVSPQKVENLLIPESYFPVLFIMAGISFSSSFLLSQQLRRSIMVSMSCVLLLFFQVRNALNWYTLLCTVVPLLLIEVSLTKMKK